MRVYKPWKKKNVEEKLNSAMFWFRAFLVVSVMQGVWQLFQAYLLYSLGKM
jgi:hypothetical protein